jgi:hypothetical protein
MYCGIWYVCAIWQTAKVTHTAKYNFVLWLFITGWLNLLQEWESITVSTTNDRSVEQHNSVFNTGFLGTKQSTTTTAAWYKQYMYDYLRTAIAVLMDSSRISLPLQYDHCSISIHTVTSVKLYGVYKEALHWHSVKSATEWFLLTLCSNAIQHQDTIRR